MARPLPGVDSLGDVAGKRVLVRSDLNVPLDDGRITDDGRIRASVPQIRSLLDAGAKVVVTAHLGRPKGTPDPRYSLAPVARRLGELLGRGGRPGPGGGGAAGPGGGAAGRAARPGGPAGRRRGRAGRHRGRAGPRRRRGGAARERPLRGGRD